MVSLKVFGIEQDASWGFGAIRVEFRWSSHMLKDMYLSSMYIGKSFGML